MFMVILIAIFSIMFAGCQEEIMPVTDEITAAFDVAAIKAQLKNCANLTKEQVVDSLSKKTGLKSATVVDLSHVVVKPLTDNTFTVSETEAVKRYGYLETKMNGYRNAELTILQVFQVNNGIVNTSEFKIKAEIGPASTSNSFYLSSTNYLIRSTYHFHFNDGEQISYFGEENSQWITLQSYADGYWEMVFDYNINGLPKKYATGAIDYFSENNELPLDLQLSSENTVAVIEMDRNLIIGADRLEVEGYDTDGGHQYMTIPIVFNKNMPDKIYVSLPIDPATVYICGNNSCSFYEAKIVGIKDGNISVFNLDPKW